MALQLYTSACGFATRACGVGFGLVAALTLLSGSAFAWTFPEHREITMLAVQGLDAERREVLDRLWREARTGQESRLCPQAIDASETLTPSCIDWVSLPAIAGDHSCSSTEMLETVLMSDWILQVAAIGAQLEADLAKIPLTAPTDEDASSSSRKSDARERSAERAARAERSNTVRKSDTRLQAADPELATRASGNFAHFLLPRPDTNLDPSAYAALTLRAGSPLNAIGVHAWFHLSALQKASRLGKDQLTDEQRRTLARSVLFDEAFALHFLEDSFAAGHVAGSWGDVAQRKGTHDYYNANGLEVFTWQRHDHTIVLMGDAYMRPQDAEVAANAVRTSLGQVLDEAAGRSSAQGFSVAPSASMLTDDFDVCKNASFPARENAPAFDSEYRAAEGKVLLQTPVPSLGAGPGEVPRFRSELGVFLGLGASIDGRAIDGGFVDTETETGYVGALDISLRGGIGLEGALGGASDGLVFGSIGLRSESNSSNTFANGGAGTLNGSLSSAIPGRTGLSLRFRMPFWVVPGDLIFASPLYFINRDKYTKMAITASDGGLIPWQVVRATRIGTFQFMIGREIGVTFFGRHRVDQLVVPSQTPGELGQIVDYESLSFDLPIVEYRPFRNFSSKQSSALQFQLFVGADVPSHVTVAYPAGTPAPDLDTVWSVGIRMVFDWRHYR